MVEVTRSGDLDERGREKENMDAKEDEAVPEDETHSQRLRRKGKSLPGKAAVKKCSRRLAEKAKQ